MASMPARDVSLGDVTSRYDFNLLGQIQNVQGSERNVCFKIKLLKA